MSSAEKPGFPGLDHRRILLAAICAGIIKVGVMDLALELDQPLGLADGLWATIIYMSCFLALGIPLNAWRNRRGAE